MARYTEQEKQEIIGFIEANRPLASVAHACRPGRPKIATRGVAMFGECTTTTVGAIVEGKQSWQRT